MVQYAFKINSYFATIKFYLSLPNNIIQVVVKGSLISPREEKLDEKSLIKDMFIAMEIE